jgi:hypothetical protein
MIARILMTASAGVILALGMIHLVYTFHGPKLAPRDPSIQEKMQQGSLVLSGEINVWKAWVGFNASHSFGLILFGLLYGYFALAKSDVLFRSSFLLAVGLGMLLGLLVLARLYWFSAPVRGVFAALLCYIASIVVSWVSVKK